MPWDTPGSTAIVILTREAEPLVGAVYREHANAGRDGMTPHVTLLVPFVPDDLLDQAVGDRVRRTFAQLPPFAYRLRRLERFERVLYLAPEPPSPFVDLISALTAEFPEYPPYDGAHDTIIPHVTVAESNNDELLARIRADLEPLLPIECRAEAATIVERGADLQWRPRAAFPLGGKVT